APIALHSLSLHDALPIYDFLWVICQKPKLPHAQIEKDLRAEPVIAQVTRITELGVGFHSVEAFLLQFVCVDFCSEPYAAAFLAHVNQNAVALLLNLPERRMQLISTITAARSENVAGETLTVHPHHRWLALVDLPFDQREMVLPI